MDKLKDGVILYHGSYCIVKNIELSKCNLGKDFGKGFYLTTSYEQAKSFVKLSVKNAFNLGILNKFNDFGYLNSYKFNLSNKINEYDFEDADINWLHFVAGNRDQTLFQDMIKEFTQYNIVGGKIANDKTAITLSQYISGAFGTPGNRDVDDIAIKLLLPNRLENQYCFRNNVAISSLNFLNAEEISL